MIKYTHKENESMMAPLTLQAHMLGLLDGDAKLVYSRGGRGYAPEVYVEKTVESGLDGTKQRLRQPRPQWVPEFGYKDGPSVAGNALILVSNVLYSVEKLKDQR
jgi:hypothetical protein